MKYSLSILAALSASLLSLSASKKHIIIDVLDDRNDTSLTTLPDASLNTGVSAYVRGALGMNDGGGGHFISDGSEWIEQSKLNVIYQKSTDGLADTITVLNPSPNMAVTGSVDLVEWGVIPNVTWVQNGDGSSTATIPALPALQPKGFYRVEEVERNNEAVILFVEGQSNAHGYGFKPEYDMDDLPRKNMYQFSFGHERPQYVSGEQFDITQAFLPTQNRRPYLDTGDISGENSVSFCFYMAKKLAEQYPKKDVIIVKNTYGGSSLAVSWSNTTSGDMRGSGESILFRAKEELEKQYESVSLLAHVWHQGEGDSRFGRSSLYEERLVEFVNNRRDFFSTIGFSKPPFICGTMVSSWIASTGAEAITVDAVHRNISTLVENATFADLSGVTDLQDTIHFGADGLEDTGEIYYTALNTLEKSDVFVKPALEMKVKGGELFFTEQPERVYNAGVELDGGISWHNGLDAYGFKNQMSITSDSWSKLVHVKLASNVGTQNLISGDRINGASAIPFYITGNNIRVSSNDASNFSMIEVPLSSTTYGEWTTLAVVHDAGVTTLYDQNGVLGNATDAPADYQFSSVAFGAYTSGSNGYNGGVKLMALYDEALTQDFITNTHNDLIQVEDVNLTNGVLARYDFDDLTNSSSAGSRFDLVPFSGVVTLSSGVADFDGLSSLSIPSITEEEVAVRYVRFRSDGDTGAGQNLVTALNLGPDYLGSPFWIEPASDTLKAGGGSVWSPQGVNSGGLSQNTDYYDGVWRKAATRYVKRGDDLWVSLFVDGELISELPTSRNSSMLGLTNNNMLIGSFGNSNYLDGEIDQVILYGRALNDTEMKALTTP